MASESKKRRWKQIKPKYIKNTAGKVTGIYLDKKVYDGILQTVSEWEKIKEQLVEKHKKKNRQR